MHWNISGYRVQECKLTMVANATASPTQREETEESQGIVRAIRPRLQKGCPNLVGLHDSRATVGVAVARLIKRRAMQLHPGRTMRIAVRLRQGGIHAQTTITSVLQLHVVPEKGRACHI